MQTNLWHVSLFFSHCTKMKPKHPRYERCHLVQVTSLESESFGVVIHPWFNCKQQLTINNLYKQTSHREQTILTCWSSLVDMKLQVNTSVINWMKSHNPPTSTSLFEFLSFFLVFNSETSRHFGLWVIVLTFNLQLFQTSDNHLINPKIWLLLLVLQKIVFYMHESNNTFRIIPGFNLPTLT